jgi:AcrR family transcriptional regulator
VDIHAMTMKEIATHLGIGIATLYRYVQDRDELVRLAVGQSSHRSPPQDIDQPWQDLVEGYAFSIYSALGGSPDLIRAYIDGALGPELEVEFLDGFLSAMTRRGFDPVMALEIFSALGMIAIGAAVATTHATAEHARRGSFSDNVRAVLDARPPGDLATLRSAVAIYGDLDARTDWRTGISHLIRSIAASRD